MRDRLLDAAEAEFFAYGYGAASTNRILDRFGGSKATLFRHFPTKNAMFSAVVRRIALRMQARVQWETIADAGPEAWLMEFGRRAMAALLTPDSLFVGKMVIAEGAAFPDVRDVFIDTAIAPMLGLLAERLGIWSTAGLIVSDDAAADAVLLLDTVMSGWLSRSLFGVGPAPTPEIIEIEVGRAVRVYLYGKLVRQA